MAIILAAATCASPLAAQSEEPNASNANPEAAPSDREAEDLNAPAQTAERQAIVLSVPVLRRDSPLGEANISVTPSGDVSYDAASIIRILAPLLSDTGQQRVTSELGSEQFVDAASLAAAGLELRFDMSRLEVVVESIAPELQPVVDLDSTNRFQQLPPTIAPADFSAYLNLAGSFDYSDGANGSELRNPDILAFGAVRSGNFALQYEGGLSEQTDGSYGPYRRFVRGIYDIEPRNIRLSAGDLQTETLPILSTQLIGGIGIERRRRLFDPFDPVFQLGGRRLRIESPSTLEIMNNGSLVRTLNVDQGIYDLDELPLIFGANDVEIVIRDAAGRTSITDFSYFYDPVELAAGDYEYGGYVGFVSDLTNIEPDYNGDLAATGYYRRAFNASLLLGVGAQISNDVQALAGEMRWVPQSIPGVIETQAAISNGSDGFGYSGSLGYRWARTTPEGGQQISAVIDYESPEFELVGRPDFFNEERLSITASYGQSLSLDTYISSGLSLFKRSRQPDRRTVFADIVHEISPSLRGSAGVEYGENDGFGSSFGARVRLTWLIDRDRRADASYESRRDLFRAGFSRSLDDNVGAVGYDINVERDSDRNTIDGSLRYRGNRFDSRLFASTGGRGIGNVFDERRARLQVSTALAYADGTFGVGRTINDGFALVAPHPRIDYAVVVGSGLNNGEYQARSGMLGAAVVPDVIGYQNREIIYDIDSTQSPFDVGTGVDRLRLATGGGARIIVGNARFVSAVGTLREGEGYVSLLSGSVTSDTDEGFEPLAFFTNSVGRFSIIGLAPGETYKVTLRDGREFTLDVPEDSEGLYRVGTLAIEEAD